MICMSFNACDVGGTSKLNSLKRLIRDNIPRIVLVQETMLVGDKAQEAFEPWLNSYYFCTLDTIDLSSDLLIT